VIYFGLVLKSQAINKELNKQKERIEKIDKLRSATKKIVEEIESE